MGNAVLKHVMYKLSSQHQFFPETRTDHIYDFFPLILGSGDQSTF